MSRLTSATLITLFALLSSACGTSQGTPAASTSTNGAGASPATSSDQATGAPASGELETTEFLIGATHASFAQLPTLIADDLGYFEDEGLSVTFAFFRSGSESVAALASNTVAFSGSGLSQLMQANGQGAELVQVVRINDSATSALVVSSDIPGVESITEIADMAIGVTGLGSDTAVFVKAAFATNGLDPNDANLVAVGNGATAIAALENDQVQAVTVTDPAITQLVDSGVGYILYDTRTPEGAAEVYGGDWVGAGFSTSQEFLANNPNTVNAAARAVVRGMEYLREHTAEEVLAVVDQELWFPGGDTSAMTVLLENNRIFGGDGTTPSDLPARVAEVQAMAGLEYDFSRVDLNKIYYNGWAE